MLIMFCILLPAMCICVVVVVFFKRFCARLARRVDLLDDNNSVSTEPLLDGPPSSSSTTTGKKVLKYGFDETFEKKTTDTGSNDGGRATPGSCQSEDTACALCMSRKADIVFLPCYHCYCCSHCSVSLEKHRKKEGILCPFCRQPVDCMVNLAKVYKLNPHQRKRGNEGSSSTTAPTEHKEEVVATSGRESSRSAVSGRREEEEEEEEYEEGYYEEEEEGERSSSSTPTQPAAGAGAQQAPRNTIN